MMLLLFATAPSIKIDTLNYPWKERMRKTILRCLMLSFIRIIANTRYALFIANNLKAEDPPFSQYLRDFLFTGIFFSILLPKLHKSSIHTTAII